MVKIQVQHYGKNSNGDWRLLSLIDFSSREKAEKFAKTQNELSKNHKWDDEYLIEDYVHTFDRSGE